MQAFCDLCRRGHSYHDDFSLPISNNDDAFLFHPISTFTHTTINHRRADAQIKIILSYLQATWQAGPHISIYSLIIIYVHLFLLSSNMSIQVASKVPLVYVIPPHP
ncbi:hypothetical protein BJV82DRAFT_710230 [Fennellomyces sp. T-0311]|nr:hypothetical protein BJV82DRAFT_710230 [Fennellomyces sp. T-0311]